MARRVDDERTVAERLFAVLDAFNLDDSESLTATELAARARLPLSTAHRLAEQCAQWGGLERAPGGGYQVGQKLWQLGLHSNRIPALRRHAAPILEALNQQCGHPVQIAARDASTALCLRFLPNRDGTNERAWLGWNVPLHCTAEGLVLLAFAPDEVVGAVLATPLRRYTRRTITSLAELRERLAAVRASGIAVARGEYMAGVDSIAAPIRDASGRVISALSMTVRTELAKGGLEQAVVQAGAAVSGALGWKS